MTNRSFGRRPGGLSGRTSWFANRPCSCGSTRPRVRLWQIRSTTGCRRISFAPKSSEWQVRNLSAAQLRRFSFFEGHISPSALSEIFTSLRAFTMLRAPKERLLSCYFYWKQGSRSAKSQFLDAVANLSLDEFLRSKEPIIRRATWNVQARLLAGGQFGGIDGQRQNVFGPWLTVSGLAAEAVRSLDRFAFVGTAERYETSLRILIFAAGTR